MSDQYKPLDPAIKNNFEYLKEYLHRPEQSTPNVELPIMSSCLGLLDAILKDRLVICELEALPAPIPDPNGEAAPEETE